jgi:hypothetical protein
VYTLAGGGEGARRIREVRARVRVVAGGGRGVGGQRAPAPRAARAAAHRRAAPHHAGALHAARRAPAGLFFIMDFFYII